MPEDQGDCNGGPGAWTLIAGVSLSGEASTGPLGDELGGVPDNEEAKG